ncbi:hypothetical protein TNCV_1371491 [Trichonephila clavipes]|nr:hypothetical protein TNCV_1371491 [Trichonephila clavipes]
MRHGVKQILNICLRKSIPYYLHTQPKFVCRSNKMKITSETPPNDIPHMFNRGHIRRIRRPRKKLYLLRIKIGFDSLGDMWTGIILLEYSPWQSLQERNSLGL